MIDGPCVLNMRHGTNRHAVAVDRQGPWGNPFRIGTHGDRRDVLIAHEDWLRSEVELVAELWRLKGRFLMCWCDPLPCHGWLLFYLANCTADEQIEWLLGDRFWTSDMLRYRSVPGAPGCHVRLYGEL